MALLCLLMGMLASAPAEEMNGLSVTVSKKTLERADDRRGYYYDRIDRTQALKATVKNVSFKEMPEGEVEWTILVRKYLSSTIEKYEGKEKLKALKPAEAVEMTIGAAQIHGWRGYYEQHKDKFEYQLVVKQGGKETMRTASDKAFDALAKRAVRAPNRQ